MTTTNNKGIGMNIRLSTYANRVAGKNCVLVEKAGIVKSPIIFKSISRNLKENMLECIYRGLKHVKPEVSHEDFLWIEVQNNHLNNWLSGKEEYKGYEEYLDKVYDVLEGIDCQYKFLFNSKPFAKTYALDKKVEKPKYEGIDSAFDL